MSSASAPPKKTRSLSSSSHQSLSSWCHQFQLWSRSRFHQFQSWSLSLLSSSTNTPPDCKTPCWLVKLPVLPNCCCPRQALLLLPPTENSFSSSISPLSFSTSPRPNDTSPSLSKSKPRFPKKCLSSSPRKTKKTSLSL